MPKLTKRTQPLTKPQQREFVSYHIPGRIQVIEGCFADQGQIPYGKLAAAAIFARAIAAFLGFSTRSGRLHPDHTYFPHEPGRSWEVKLSDIDGGSCLALHDLTTQERDALENGINETNRAFAHLTYWDVPADQDSRGRATEIYRRAQVQRLRLFAETVVAVFRRATAGLPK